MSLLSIKTLQFVLSIKMLLSRWLVQDRIYGKEKPAIHAQYLNLSTPHIHANIVKR